MKSLARVWIGGWCLGLAAVPALAQTAALDELLKQVRQGSAQAAAVNKEREARFLRNKNEQVALQAKADGDLATAKTRADQVKGRFDANQKQIAELKRQLQTRAGDYTQVYAAVRQIAGDFRAVAADSLVSAQYPERLDFLEELSRRQELPAVSDLEKLWFVLQQEMTENGKVARFESEIVDDYGVRAQADVVRVGSFTAFTGDRFLALSPGGTQLVALTRQPGDAARDTVADFTESRVRAPVIIDPSRGTLLLIEGERPSLLERIEQGGVVGYVIICIGVAGLIIAVFQLLYLGFVGRRMRRQLQNTRLPSLDNPLGRVLATFRDDRSVGSDDPELLELRLSEAVLRETPALERAQSILRLFVAVAPLLGLLGTVTGMIVTFQTITVFGTGDPKLMADGISQALVTTVQGLCVAIPLLFISSLMSTRSRALVQVLDEQSAGLLARRMEAARA